MNSNGLSKAVEYWIINDPIYGLIKFPKKYKDGNYSTIYKIINHPHFQRLRRIKQLSFVNLVYPGANHTRFEHSIGVAWLVKLAMEHILDVNLHKKLKCKSVDLIKLVNTMVCAGLLHDIGQGPFSHVFERFWFDGKIKHETIAEAVVVQLQELKDSDDSINKILEEGEKKDLCKLARNIIANMINGVPIIEPDAIYTENIPGKWKWTSDIVDIYDKFRWDYGYIIDKSQEANIITKITLAENHKVARKIYNQMKKQARKDANNICTYQNLINSNLDCDKMDYLMRDNYYCGKPVHVDYEYIIHSMRTEYNKHVCNEHVVFHAKATPAIKTLLTTRYFHYPQIAFNKTNHAIEAMVIRIMANIKDLSVASKNHFAEKDNSLNMIFRGFGYQGPSKGKTGIGSNNIKQLVEVYFNIDDGTITNAFKYFAFHITEEDMEKTDRDNEKITLLKKLCGWFFKRIIPQRISYEYLKNHIPQSITEFVNKDESNDQIRERIIKEEKAIGNLLNEEYDNLNYYIIVHDTKNISEYDLINSIEDNTYREAYMKVIENNKGTKAHNDNIDKLKKCISQIYIHNKGRLNDNIENIFSKNDKLYSIIREQNRELRKYIILTEDEQKDKFKEDGVIY